MPLSRISFIKTVHHPIKLPLFIMMLLWVQSARAQHWSVQNYENIISQIAEHHDELATTANTSGFKLRTPDITNGMVEMSYMFGYDDPQFGINGHMPLLNKFEVVGKDPSWIKYNFHTINQAMVGMSGTVQTGNPFVSDALNASNTPWLTKSGEMLEYLNHRTDQWELGLTPLSTSEKNPWRRSAATVGMFYDTTGQNNQSSYANNYIVTFTVDKDAIFRPNGNQSVFGAGMDTAVAADFQWHAGTSTWKPDTNFNEPWLSTLNNNLHRPSGTKYDTFGSFYQSWWNQNLLTGSNFPWTGIGYTYDWYYQDKSEWSDMGPGNQPKGAGLSEFVLMPSKSGNMWEIGNIVNIQTTAQYLGDSQAWGSSMQSYSTPEPNSFYMFGIIAILVIGIKVIRQRKRALWN